MPVRYSRMPVLATRTDNSSSSVHTLGIPMILSSGEERVYAYQPPVQPPPTSTVLAVSAKLDDTLATRRTMATRISSLPRGEQATFVPAAYLHMSHAQPSKEMAKVPGYHDASRDDDSWVDKVATRQLQFPKGTGYPTKLPKQQNLCHFSSPRYPKHSKFTSYMILSAL